MVAIILAVVYLQGAGFFLRHLGVGRGFEPPSLTVRLVLAVVGAVVYMVVHEAGHRIAGAALGWRCVRFGFGPFEFFRDREGWKKERVKMLCGAFVRQVPPSFTNFRREKATTLLSGPLASLIFGEIFAMIALISGSAAVFTVFSHLAMYTLLGVLELIPREKNGIGSDGYRLLQVIRGGKPIEDMIRETMAEASNFTTLRHRDWPHALIVRLAAKDDPYDVYLAYLHTMDADNIEAASAYMRRLIAFLPEEKPSSHSACEAAYWLATYGRDSKRARKWIERVRESADPDLLMRAEAAVALAEGEPGRAEGLAKEALSRIHRPAGCGSDAYEIDRLHLVLNRAQSRTALLGDDAVICRNAG